MGNESSHHVASCYHTPLLISVTPYHKPEYAAKVNKLSQRNIGGGISAQAGIAGADVGLNLHADLAMERDEENVKSRHDDNWITLLPGRMARIGTGKGDFLTIREKGGKEQMLAQNHQLQKNSGLIVTPTGAIADAKDDESFQTTTGTSYAALAEYFRKRTPEQIQEMLDDLQHENITEHLALIQYTVGKKPKN